MAWGWGLHQYLFDWGYFMGIDWVHTGTGMGGSDLHRQHRSVLLRLLR